MDSKNFVAVDIGNTTCEFAIFKEDNLIFKVHIPSKPLNVEDIKDLVDAQKYFNNALFIVSSVVKPNNSILKSFLEQQYNAKVLIIDSTTYNFLLKTQTRDISSIGLDIIAKCEWAINNKKNPCIIVDVGTATVVQYIDEKGYMNKVAITLGLTSIYKALKANTDALPVVGIEKTKEALGFDTVSAMQRGIYWGYIGSVDSLINKAIEETSCNNIFITGGLSGLIVDDLKIKPYHNSNIIFEGIKVILKNNIHKLNNL